MASKIIDGYFNNNFIRAPDKFGIRDIIAVTLGCP